MTNFPDKTNSLDVHADMQLHLKLLVMKCNVDSKLLVMKCNVDSKLLVMICTNLSNGNHFSSLFWLR